MELFKYAVLYIIINSRIVRGQQLTCPGGALFSYVTHPRDPCQVFLCYAGRMLFTPFQCRPDFELDACSGCIYPTTTTPMTPPSSSTVSTSAITLSISPVLYEMSHVIGGHRAARGVSEAYCLLLCQLSPVCRAVDYNKIELSCWLHEADTACSPLVRKIDCVHYRLTSCISTSETTTIPTSATTTSSVMTSTITTTASVSVANGFVSSALGKHIKGGTRTLISVTEQQCLDFCLMESFCLAVDYNTVDNSCYIHFRDTYCGEMTDEAGTNHYSRLPCVRGIENVAFEVRNKFHVLGGTRHPSGITLQLCLTICFLDPNCVGIDFDSSLHACYTFVSENTCDPLIPKDFCMHVTLQQCTFPQRQLKSLVTPTPSTTPATDVNITSGYLPPNGDFIVINYPGPMTLPSQWQAYPGMRIDNGIPVGGINMTGDQCLSLCLDDPRCEAVDFNSGDGTCYKHEMNGKCNVLLAANAVYHVKKPGLCSVITGTTTQYPTPLGVAP